MHVLITYLLLIITILSIFVLTSIAKKTAYLWLVGLSGVLLAFMSIWIWRIELPHSIILFFGSQELNVQPLLHTTQDSWTVSLILTLTFLSILLSSSSSTFRQSGQITWILAVSGILFGLLAINAGNFYLLIITFGALDVIEFLEINRSPSSQDDKSNYPIINFTLQTVGLFMIVFVAIKSGISMPIQSINIQSTSDSFFLLIGFFLRAKIFPPPQSITSTNTQYSKSLILLMLLKTTVLIYSFSKFPVLEFSIWIKTFLIVVLLLVGIYFSWTWITIKGTSRGMQYFLISVTIIGLFDLTIGSPSSSRALAVFVALYSGLLQLYNLRAKEKSLFLLAVSLLGLGLPFTISASVWTQTHLKNFFSLPFVTLIYIFLIFGFIRHVFEGEEDGLSRQDHLENRISWISIALLTILAILLGIWGWPGAGLYGTPLIYGPITVFYISGLAIIFRFRNNLQVLINAQVPFVGNLLSTTSHSLSRVASIFFDIVNKIVGIVNALIESDGSLLWMVLILMVILLYVKGGS